MKKEFPLLPQDYDLEAESGKEGLSLYFARRAIKNFRQKKTKIKKLKKKENSFLFEEQLSFPKLKRARIPSPLNTAQLFGWDKKQLLRWAEYIENLPTTLMLYHATQLLCQPNHIRDDVNKYILQSPPPKGGLAYLAGVGKTRIPHVIMQIDDAEQTVAEPEFFSINYEEILSNSLDQFVLSMIQIGSGLKCSLPKTTDKQKIYHETTNNLKELSGAPFLEDLLTSYKNSISFKPLTKNPQIKDPMQPRFVLIKGNIATFQKEHPGRDYMERVITYLRAREFK